MATEQGNTITVTLVEPGYVKDALAAKADIVNGKVPLNQLPTISGSNGKSAYELAVDLGYSGTETQWVNSLKGTGDSAYQSAVSLGFVGTVAQWLLTLKGAPGAPGAAGATGPVGPVGPPGSTGISDIDTYVQNAAGTYVKTRVAEYFGTTAPDPTTVTAATAFFFRQGT